jgi:hypothetical protein
VRRGGGKGAGGKGRLSHEVDNFTAIYKPIIYIVYETLDYLAQCRTLTLQCLQINFLLRSIK